MPLENLKSVPKEAVADLNFQSKPPNHLDNPAKLRYQLYSDSLDMVSHGNES